MLCIKCNKSSSIIQTFCPHCGWDQRKDVIDESESKGDLNPNVEHRKQDLSDLVYTEKSLIRENDSESNVDKPITDITLDKVYKTKKEVVIDNNISNQTKSSKLNMGVFDLIALNIGTWLIVIFTLGLGYPIATAIREKYLTDRMILSGRKLRFVGSAGELYITYIKWMILTLITFGIYVFWVQRNILRWKLENTEFIDRESNEGESSFDGTVGGLFVTNILFVLIIVFTIGIGLPWALSYKTRYIKMHSIINGHRLDFNGTGGELFVKYILWFLLTIVTFGIYTFWLGLNLIKYEVEKTKVTESIISIKKHTPIHNEDVSRIPLSKIQKTFRVLFAIEIVSLFLAIVLGFAPSITGAFMNRTYYIPSIVLVINTVVLCFLGITVNIKNIIKNIKKGRSFALLIFSVIPIIVIIFIGSVYLNLMNDQFGWFKPEYEVENGVLVKHWHKGSSEIVLPQGITEINSNVFNKYKYTDFFGKITSIVLPEGLEVIKSGTFDSLKDLEYIYIPDSVITIRESAFRGVSSLTSIVIPNSVTSIGMGAFEGCSSLTIYTEALSKPDEWSYSWNYDDRPVYWLGQWEYIDGVPTPIS